MGKRFDWSKFVVVGLFFEPDMSYGYLAAVSGTPLRLRDFEDEHCRIVVSPDRHIQTNEFKVFESFK